MNINIFSASAIGIGYGAPQMSMIGFKQDQITARSGWYRLMLAEMQEKSLEEDEKRKHEQKQREAASQGTSAETPVRKTKSKRTKHVADVAEWKPPSLPKLIYRAPKQEKENQPDISLIVSDIRAMARSALNIQVPLKQEKKHIIAANDEDEEIIELMLLAA